MKGRFEAIKAKNEAVHDNDDPTFGYLSYEDTLGLSEKATDAMEGSEDYDHTPETVDAVEIAVVAYEKEVRQLIGDEAVDSVVEEHPMPEGRGEDS